MQMEEGHCRRHKFGNVALQRLRATRLVVLDETARDANLARPLLVKGLAEPTPVIQIPFWNDNHKCIQRFVPLLFDITTFGHKPDLTLCYNSTKSLLNIKRQPIMAEKP
jgi:hypothetical protein